MNTFEPTVASEIQRGMQLTGWKPGRKVDGDVATHAIQAYLRAEKKLTPDRWGNFVEPDGKTRWKIADRVLKRERKFDFGWKNMQSVSKVAFATEVLASAYATVEGAYGEVKEAEEKRLTAADKSRTKAAEKRAAEEAAAAAVKVVGMEEPDLALRSLFDRDARVALKEIEKRAAPLAAEFLRLGVPSDQQLGFHYTQPHWLAFAGYNYNSDVKVSGVTYTVTYTAHGRGQVAVEVGAVSDIRGRVDPFGHGVDFYGGEERRGDAYISGKLEMGDDGAVRASLFYLQATKKHSGAGRRILQIWTDIVKAHGQDVFIAEAVGEEGQAFIEALARHNVLEIVKRSGSYMLVGIYPELWRKNGRRS